MPAGTGASDEEPLPAPPPDSPPAPLLDWVVDGDERSWSWGGLIPWNAPPVWPLRESKSTSSLGPISRVTESTWAVPPAPLLGWVGAGDGGAVPPAPLPDWVGGGDGGGGGWGALVPWRAAPPVWPLSESKRTRTPGWMSRVTESRSAVPGAP